MSDMLTDICAKIALIGAEITGISSTGVFDPPPANLQTADLPAMFTWTSAAQHNESMLGEDFVETTRRFYVQIAVIPMGQGDPNTREKLARPLIEATLTTFRKHPKLKGLDWIEKVVVGSDSGIIILPEYGGKFIGVEIPLDITYIVPRTYAANE
jgi:hypothetical protein